MNVVIRPCDPADTSGAWFAAIYSAGVWFLAPTREILVADIEHNESADWGRL